MIRVNPAGPERPGDSEPDWTRREVQETQTFTAYRHRIITDSYGTVTPARATARGADRRVCPAESDPLRRTRTATVRLPFGPAEPHEPGGSPPSSFKSTQFRHDWHGGSPGPGPPRATAAATRPRRLTFLHLAS
eukprot:463302-Hanusia_phi.AAC.5